MPQNIEAYLRNLQTTDAVRADVWDAVYASDDPTAIEQRLRGVKGLSDSTKAKLWDMRFPTAAPSSTPATDPYGANLLTRAVGAGRGVIGGIGQGVVSTALHADDLLRSASERYGSEPQPRPLQDPEVQALITPYSTAAKVGKAAEQVAEFAIPGGAAARATQGARLLPRAAAQAATAGTVATAQEGNISGATVPAVIAGAMPVAGAAAQKVGRAVMGRALEPGVQRVAQDHVVSEGGRLIERGRSLHPEALKPEHLQRVRERLTDSALNRRVTGSRTPPLNQGDAILASASKGRVVAPEAAAANILARRVPTDMPWLELTGYLLGTGGGLATGNTGLGALAALIGAGRTAATQYPAQTAIVANELGRVLTAGAGTAAGVASTSQRLTPEAEAMLQELLARELAKEGGQ